MEIITSAANQTIKRVKSLYSKKGRDADGTFVVEGAKFIAEIAPPWEVVLVMASRSYADAHGLNSGDSVIVADRIFPADTANSQGLLAVVKQRVFAVDDVLRGENPLLLVLEEISDPGNLGTMLRIAHGLGFCGVILAGDCADVYNPKVVRSSAGSLFHVPFAKCCRVADVLPRLKQHGISTFAATSAGGTALNKLDFSCSAAILIGNEARGLSDTALELTDGRVTIPAAAESLNAAVACGILAYECYRQRNLT